MKKINIFLIIVLGILSTSCQNEESEIENPNQNVNNIVVGSPLFDLISRTTQNPTEIDNVIDNCSGFSVQLPLSLTVNGVAVNVATNLDYQNVQDIKNQYTSDNDIVYLDYPVTVIFKNFSTENVSNYSQFHDLVENCEYDNGFNEIDCISFNFPLVINIYNADNQIADLITIQNNEQFYNYINGLNSNIIAAFAFPITMTGSSGENVIIYSNTELESFINNAIDDCVTNSGGTGTLDLETVLTSGSWYISYYYKNIDGTYYYNGYNFTFLNNGDSQVVKNAGVINGSWLIELDNGIQKLDLNFEGDSLSEIKEDWKVTEFSETNIRLKKTENSEIRYLYFAKN
ncbi:hypothetical protein FLGE108171_08670 [Flavobacterium gelidilacus]|uniref:hypothetical protein n=1 Tax=Flavobacterium gelidilacus TaxID=206041 RepID=UPI000417C13B|nr:hypothetical protein [Flavobacterium gelidilacus]